MKRQRPPNQASYNLETCVNPSALMLTSLESKYYDLSMQSHLVGVSPEYEETQDPGSFLKYRWFEPTDCKESLRPVGQGPSNVQPSLDCHDDEFACKPPALIDMIEPLGPDRDRSQHLVHPLFLENDAIEGAGAAPSGLHCNEPKCKTNSWDLTNFLRDCRQKNTVQIKEMGSKEETKLKCQNMGPCFRVVCRQTYGKGRTYAAVWFPDFFDRMFAPSVSPNDRTFNELIPSEVPCKLYLDLDIPLTESGALGAGKKAARWLSALGRLKVGLVSLCKFVCLKMASIYSFPACGGDSCKTNQEGEVVHSSGCVASSTIEFNILDSSDSSKISKHIVFNVGNNRLLFANKEHVRDFLFSCVRDWKKCLEMPTAETSIKVPDVENGAQKYSWDRNPKRQKTQNGSPAVETSDEDLITQGKKGVPDPIAGWNIYDTEQNPMSWGTSVQAEVICRNLDWSIYSGEKEFRMMECTKKGESRFLLLESTMGCCVKDPQFIATANDFFQDRRSLNESVISKLPLSLERSYLRFLNKWGRKCSVPSSSDFVLFSESCHGSMGGPKEKSARSGISESVEHFDDADDDSGNDDECEGTNDQKPSGNDSTCVRSGSAASPSPSPLRLPSIDVKTECLKTLVVPFFCTRRCANDNPNLVSFVYPPEILILHYEDEGSCGLSSGCSEGNSILFRTSCLRNMKARSRPRSKISGPSAEAENAFYASSYFNARPYGSALLENLPGWVKGLEPQNLFPGVSNRDPDVSERLTIEDLQEAFSNVKDLDAREVKKTLTIMEQYEDDPFGASLILAIGKNIMDDTGMSKSGHPLTYKSEIKPSSGSMGGMRWLIYNTHHNYKMCYLKALRCGPQNAQHTNNNTYFVVCLNNFTYYLKCHSLECEKYYLETLATDRGETRRELEDLRIDGDPKHPSWETPKRKGTRPPDSKNNKDGQFDSRRTVAKGPVKKLDPTLWPRIANFLRFNDMLETWASLQTPNEQALRV